MNAIESETKFLAAGFQVHVATYPFPALAIFDWQPGITLSLIRNLNDPAVEDVTEIFDCWRYTGGVETE